MLSFEEFISPTPAWCFYKLQKDAIGPEAIPAVAKWVPCTFIAHRRDSDCAKPGCPGGDFSGPNTAISLWRAMVL